MIQGVGHIGPGNVLYPAQTPPLSLGFGPALLRMAEA